MAFVLEIAMLTTIAYIFIAWICIKIIIFCFRCFVSYILYPFFIFIKRNIRSYNLPRFPCYKRYQIIFLSFSLHNCRVRPFPLFFRVFFFYVRLLCSSIFLFNAFIQLYTVDLFIFIILPNTPSIFPFIKYLYCLLF